MINPRPTQLEKVLQVSQRFGANAESSQFTERAIYDTLPIDTRSTYRFFEGCNARTFPFTNISENKLQKQENMVVKYISLAVVTTTTNYTTLPVVSVTDIGTLSSALYRSDLSLQIAQNQVLKPFPMDDMNPSLNPFARHTSHNVIRLGVDLVIPELLEFVAVLQTTYVTAGTTKSLQLKLHGQATIFSPRANF